VQVGGFDPDFFMYYEDVDICLRLRTIGYSVQFDPSICVVHTGRGSSSAVASRAYVEERKSLLRLMQKHRGYVQWAIAWAIQAFHAIVRLGAAGLLFAVGRPVSREMVHCNRALLAWLLRRREHLAQEVA